MMHFYPPRSVYPPRSIAIAKTPPDQAWRGRTVLAGMLAALAFLAAAALNLDWSEGAAMALGQMAGVLAPLVLLTAAVWAAAILTGRKR